MSELDLIFAKVVETGSLRAVAMERGVDPSSVSRKVSALEDRLKARLLRRSTKRSEPTEAGLRYYEGVRRLLEQRDALEAEIAGLVDQPRGRLRIGAPVDFGARFVAPVVADLMRDASGLDIELVLGSGFDNLTEAGLDAVVRIGRLSDSSLIAKRVGAVPRVVVASSQYIAEHGVLQSPEDLAAHPFVFYQTGQRRMTLPLRKRDEQVEIEVTGRASANSVSAIRELVLGSAGLHHGPLWAFEADIREGRMVVMLPEWDCTSFPLYVLWVATDFLPAKVRIFAERFAGLVARESALAA